MENLTDDVGKAFSLFCCGKTIKILRTQEQAENWKKAIIEEPELFLDIEEWEPGEFMPWVDFEDDIS